MFQFPLSTLSRAQIITKTVSILDERRNEAQNLTQ